MIATILPALLLAAAPLSAADETALDVRVAEIYRPYGDESNDRASWDYPIYTEETAALIAHWRRVWPDDEPDALNDGDWLCQCQDYDAEAFRAAPGARRALDAESAEVEVKVDLGFGDADGIREARLIFRRVGADWMLDDLFAESFPDGLKQALRETIAADEALRTSTAK